MHRSRIFAVLAALLCGGMFLAPALAHDLFLKLDSWFLEPDAPASVDLFNGTFERSDNVITRDRMVDVSIVGPAPEDVVHPPEERWSDVEQRTRLAFRTGAAGTYTLGVSTAPREIELTAEAFDRYLAHDGVVDVRAERQAAEQRSPGSTDRPVKERYSKHVKAVVQVGQTWSAGGEVALGYPIEIVPQANPYGQTVGGSLAVQVLRNGKPLGNQPIYASHGDHHEHDADGNHLPAFSSRTNSNGVAVIPLTEAGPWYVRLIHMVPCPEEGIDYESNWATLTFEVAGEAAWRKAMDHNAGLQNPSPGISVFGVVGAGLLLVIGLALVIRRKG